MNGLRLLGYDLKYGIFRRWYVFFIAIVFAAIQSNTCFKLIQSLNEHGLMRGNGSLMDYYAYSLRGDIIYIPDPQNIFLLPLFWFTFQIGVSYAVAYYTEHDLRNNGRNVILASKTRIQWWISKVITCIVSVVIYFVFTLSMITIFAKINGASMSLEMSKDFSVSNYSATIFYLNPNEILYIVIVIPLITTIAICLFQVACSLIFSSVLCFAVACGMYVLSSFYTSPWLVGNYTMWLRSSYYTEGGVSPESGIVMSVMLIVLAIVGGSYIIKNKDVF